MTAWRAPAAVCCHHRLSLLLFLVRHRHLGVNVKREGGERRTLLAKRRLVRLFGQEDRFTGELAQSPDIQPELTTILTPPRSFGENKTRSHLTDTLSSSRQCNYCDRTRNRSRPR